MMPSRTFQNHVVRLLMRVEHLLYVLLFLLLPIERGAVLEIGGFTVRPVYFVMFALMVLFVNLRLRFRLDVVVFALLMSAVALMSVGFSMEPQVSLLYALWAVFTIVFSALAVARLRYKPALAELWVRWYVHAAALWSLVAIAQWFLAFRYSRFAYSFLGDFPRVHALTLEPSYLATYLIFPLFLALTTGWAGYAALIGAALIFSTSRTGLVSLAFGLGVLLLAKLLRGKLGTLRNVKFLGVVIVISLFLGLFLPPVRGFFSSVIDFVSAGLSLKDMSSAIPRLKSWEDAYQVFMYQPWTGVGIGTYGYALRELGLAASREVDARSLKTTNLYLEVTAETGVVGLMFLMLWIAMPIWNLGRCPPFSLGFAVLLAFVVLVFTFPLIQTWWRPYLWLPWVLGVGYVCRR